MTTGLTCMCRPWCGGARYVAILSPRCYASAAHSKLCQLSRMTLCLNMGCGLAGTGNTSHIACGVLSVK